MLDKDCGMVLAAYSAPSMSKGFLSSQYFIRRGSNTEAVHPSIAAHAGAIMVLEAAAAYSSGVESSSNGRWKLAVPYPLDIIGTLICLPVLCYTTCLLLFGCFALSNLLLLLLLFYETRRIVLKRTLSARRVALPDYETRGKNWCHVRICLRACSFLWKSGAQRSMLPIMYACEKTIPHRKACKRWDIQWDARYIHENPVRRGLAESPEDWFWSSCRAHYFGETKPLVVDTHSIPELLT
ncbi:MAG: hypothetical protein HZA50_01570 [Planctomycetes bacterium]|nr:hypothetical protein [Planctomycetota bacterium]